jgi:pilus assembly protein CpaF
MMATARTVYNPNSLEALCDLLPPLAPYLDDSSISEIMVNRGGRETWVEDRAGMRRVNLDFSRCDLREAVIHIARLNGKDISEYSPILDTRLEDGSRVSILYPPVSVDGVSLNIRKFRKELFTLAELERIGSVTSAQRALLLDLVSRRKSGLIVGGTTSGKTTLLNAIGNEISDRLRIVQIEDTAEIQINSPNLVRLEAQPPQVEAGVILSPGVTHSQLVKASLRARPDIIILGEVRSKEAFDLLQALNTGHAGSLSTIHANDPEGAVNRLAVLALMGAPSIPFDALVHMAVDAIDYLVHIVRDTDTNHRSVDSIQSLSHDRTGKTLFTLGRLD